jgi:hypothetical protein
MNKPELAEQIESAATVAVDYPAAHSMDSTWWAVDGHGHVAQVNTGEAGAMPAAAGEPASSVDAIVQLAEAGVPFYCEDLFSVADGKLYLRSSMTIGDSNATHPQEPTFGTGYPTGYLLWFRDEMAVEQIIPSQSPGNTVANLAQRFTRLFTAPPQPDPQWHRVRLPVPRKVVFWVEWHSSGGIPHPDRIRELLAAGVLLRAWGYDYGDLELARFGLFGYELATFDNWIAGPFERGAAPPQPLRLDDLPPAFREALNLCPLPDHDFRREPLLQPFEEGEAFAWGPQWVSTTGRVYSTSQHGPDLPDRAAQVVASLPVVPGESSLRALAAAYLSGEAEAIDVLNDYLEETGRPRLRDHAAPGARLDELLFELLSSDERTSAEIAMVEHVVPNSATPEIAAAAQQAIDAARNEDVLQTAASAALAAWMPEDAGVDEQSDEEVVRSRDNGVAWAAWALARRWPLVAARTARTVHPGELAWQMQLVRLTNSTSAFCGVCVIWVLLFSGRSPDAGVFEGVSSGRAGRVRRRPEHARGRAPVSGLEILGASDQAAAAGDRPGRAAGDA